METAVRDCDGHVVWRVKVTPGELTCTACGETFPGNWSGCPRCTGDEPDRSSGLGSRYRRTPAVPTVSYLHEGEYSHDSN